MTLRAYQVDALERIRAAYRAGSRSILCVAPTGFGKTSLAAAVVEGAVAKGRRVLWLTHRRELVTQAAARLKSIGVEAGIALAGEARRPELPIQVASVATLTAAGEAPDDIKIAVVDEAHHTTAATWRAILAAYPDLDLTLGLTASAARGDGTALGDCYSSLVVASSVAALVALNAIDPTLGLVPCTVIAPARRTKTLAQDPVDAYLDAARGKRALVFTSTVEGAHELTARFVAGGVPAECVEGNTNTDDRAGALERLATGETLVVVNVMCLTEGVDVPSVECIIVARGCTSLATWIQMVGRGLRPSPSTGKTRCLVLDLRGHVHAHGLPDDAVTFSLEGRPVKLTDARPASLRQCRKCGAVYRPAVSLRSCPRCGAPVPPPLRPRVEADTLAAVQRGAVATWAEKRALFLRLCDERARRGFHPKWVGARYRAELGAWPPWPLPGAARASRRSSSLDELAARIAGMAASRA